MLTAMFLSRFISVSNALPKTSYVKMIDLWLLFNLTIPFAEMHLKDIAHNGIMKLYALRAGRWLGGRIIPFTFLKVLHRAQEHLLC